MLILDVFTFSMQSKFFSLLFEMTKFPKFQKKINLYLNLNGFL